jgi:alanyl-tRNA synthetase
MTAVMQDKKTAYDTDIFLPIMAVAKTLNQDEKSARIISDHVRTAVFMIADGVIPSNTDRGYILRRLLRRAIRRSSDSVLPVIDAVIEKYKETHPELNDHEAAIRSEIKTEEEKFRKTLTLGLHQLKRVLAYNLTTGEEVLREQISAKTAFDLYQSFGFPIELTVEEARVNGINRVDVDGFEKLLEEHQALSRAGAEQKFKGGLAFSSEMSVKYHTATHHLHQALYDVLGPEVGQKGSNITAERLRFDFSFPRKMTDEEKKRVEDIVNEKIAAALPVNKAIMNKEEAEKTGARHFFGEKYPDEVSVYYIGDSLESAYSKEFCGGPHVSNTSELGHFKISKEEAVSAGVRRIKAVLE